MPAPRQPATPLDRMTAQHDLLTAMGIVPLAGLGGTAFRRLAALPAGFAERFPTLCADTVDLAVEFPFLVHFLDDATPFWQAPPGGRPTLRSGPWTQTDAQQRSCVLEATAVRDGDGQPVLLLEILGADFAELQDVLQNAREQRLALENLQKVHKALGESARQLHWMAEERKAAVELVRRSRDDLEDRVAERTARLLEVNEQLQKEIAERASVNAQLVEHQEQLRSLAEQLATAEEQERRQVAEFLHDRIGQNLALVKMRLLELARTLPAEPTAKLQSTASLVDEVIADTRGLTADLGTPVLYELGLGEALAQLVRRFEQVHGITARHEDDGRDKPLGEASRLCVYQAVRELLHNVVKHADTDLVIVRTARDGEQFVASVVDRGAGFDSRDHVFRVTPSGGFGLFNIRERALHLGGSFELRSQPGRGTEAVLTIPLARGAEVNES